MTGESCRLLAMRVVALLERAHRSLNERNSPLDLDEAVTAVRDALNTARDLENEIPPDWASARTWRPPRSGFSG